MEKLGGGGHFNLAACQRENITVLGLETELLKVIDQEIEKE